MHLMRCALAYTSELAHSFQVCFMCDEGWYVIGKGTVQHEAARTWDRDYGFPAQVGSDVTSKLQHHWVAHAK
jgi:hypothetical protein